MEGRSLPGIILFVIVAVEDAVCVYVDCCRCRRDPAPSSTRAVTHLGPPLRECGTWLRRL